MSRRFTAGTVSAVLLLCIAGPASARTATYAGVTSDGVPVVLTTAGKQVRSMTLHWIADCPSGQVIPFAGTVKYAGKPGPPPSLTVGKSSLYTTAISKKGKFTGNVYGLIDEGPDLFVQVTGFLAGKLGATAGSGSYSMLVSVLDATSGSLIERCSVDAKYKVGHNALTYGGATSQGEPIAITVNKQRTKVTSFDVGYRMDCPGGQFLMPAESFFFKLSGGKFAASFDDSSAFPDGSSRKVFYNFGGSVKKTVAKGSMTMTTMEIDAQGNVQTEGCGTPSITFKAVSG
jgi:hypothetical protein